MEVLLTYFMRITPGLTLVALMFFLLPKKQLLAKVFILIFGFILIRDAMTPLELWSFGLTDTAIWLRFTDNSFVLYGLVVLCAVMSLLLLRLKELRRMVRWGNIKALKTYLMGFGIGLLVAAPFVLLGLGVPLEEKGGTSPLVLLPAIILVSYVGNFLEELIFRGFLQSHLETQMNSIRAAALSGVMFATAHIFLASTVTDLGWPVLVFVTIEGLGCAFVYRKYGLISATLVHGTVIFLASSGLM